MKMAIVMALMMEAAGTAETALNFYQISVATAQKAAVFRITGFFAGI
jgi:uncharacterized lipoprotein YmbA